jgi:hypothetical protein
VITSSLVTRKNAIEVELRRGVSDPKRKSYLLARLQQLNRDIQSLGFSEAEIEKNDILTGNDKDVTVGNRQYLVPLPEWMKDKK